MLFVHGHTHIDSQVTCMTGTLVAHKHYPTEVFNSLSCFGSCNARAPNRLYIYGSLDSSSVLLATALHRRMAQVKPLELAKVMFELHRRGYQMPRMLRIVNRQLYKNAGLFYRTTSAQLFVLVQRKLARQSVWLLKKDSSSPL